MIATSFSEENSEDLTESEHDLDSMTATMRYHAFSHLFMRVGLTSRNMLSALPQNIQSGAYTLDLIAVHEKGLLLGLDFKLLDTQRFYLALTTDTFYFTGDESNADNYFKMYSSFAHAVGLKGDIRLFESNIFISLYFNRFEKTSSFLRTIGPTTLEEDSNFITTEYGLAFSFEI